jgi:hypothetical protein
VGRNASGGIKTCAASGIIGRPQKKLHPAAFFFQKPLYHVELIAIFAAECIIES